MGRLDIIVTRAHLSAHGNSIDVDVPWGDLGDLPVAIADLQTQIAAHEYSRVSVASDQLGLVFLDVRGLPLTDVVWADDQRSADDAAWCNKKFPEQWWIDHIGETPQTRHGITKLSWLHRSEPDVWALIAHVCGIDDHVRRLLNESSSANGQISDLVTSAEFVTSMGIASRGDVQIDQDVLALIDRDRDWRGVFAPIHAPGSVVGSWNGVDIVI